MTNYEQPTPESDPVTPQTQALVAPSIDHPTQLYSPALGTISVANEGVSSADEGISISRLIHSFRRRWLIGTIAALFVSAVVAANLIYWIPTKFEAEALLRVRRQEEPIMQMIAYRNDTDADYKTYKETQAALIRSPYVINAALRRSGVSQIPMIKRETNPVAWLIDHLSVGYMRNSEILRLALKGEDEEEAIRIVDAIKDAYVEEIVVAERASQLTRLDVLKRSYRKNVSDIKEKDEVVYKIKDQIGSPDAFTAELRQELEMGKLKELQKQKSKLEGRLTEVNTQLEVLFTTRGLLNLNPTEFEIEDQMYFDPRYNILQQDIYELTTMFKQVAATAPPASLNVERIRASLRSKQAEAAHLRDEMKPRIVDRIKRTRGSDEGQREEIRQLLSAEQAIVNRDLQLMEQRVEEGEQLVKEMGGYSSELTSREDELNSLRKMTELMKIELDSLDLELQKTPRITLMQSANVPDANDWIAKYTGFSLATLLTFVLIFGGIGFLDYQTHKISVSEDVSRDTSTRVIGSLPLLQDRHSRVFGRLDKGAQDFVLTASIDSIRTQILCDPKGEKNDVIMVTSASNQEGKSTVAGQLAISLARSGRRTLLIDADVHNPHMHHIFELPYGQGFCELLRDVANVEDLVHAVDFEGLWLMTAGFCDAFALQALAGDVIGKVIAELKSQYDFIVVDAGPVLSGPNALLIGQHADATILSTRKDVSRAPKINDACSRLRSVGIDIMGAVVNSSGVELRKAQLHLAESQAESTD